MTVNNSVSWYMIHFNLLQTRIYFFPEYGGSIYRRNIGIYLPKHDFTGSRRDRRSSSKFTAHLSDEVVYFLAINLLYIMTNPR
jgi:hypothetical protein